MTREFRLLIYNSDSDREVMALYEDRRQYDESNELIMYGDWYHDKISIMIEGFFEGLDYIGVEYNVTNEFRESGDPFSEIEQLYTIE